MSSSGNWLTRQAKDIYVRKAKVEGYRARSAYKLQEINRKFRLMTPGSAVAECGSAPGAWTQIAAAACNSQGSYMAGPAGIVVGCDLLDIEPVKGATLFKKHDFTHPETQEKMIQVLGRQKQFDVVLSDMAPNVSGNHQLDSDSLVELTYVVLRFAALNTQPGGHFVSKIFHGKDVDRLITDVERFYDNVFTFKPKASRNESSEKYIVGKYFKGLKNKQ